MRVFAIGASAGGVEALRDLVRMLPADFESPLLVVIHLSEESPGVLPGILDRAGPLRAVRAEAGMHLEPATIHVAPPGRHLLVEGESILVTTDPRVNGYRPAIDPLFRSVAHWHGSAAVGVILTGNLADGSAGLVAIKRHGGMVVVQDPEDAIFKGMPQSALRAVQADHVVPLHLMAETLAALDRSPVASQAQPHPAASEAGAGHDGEAPAEHDDDQPAIFRCPDCGGPLFDSKDEDVLHFRCIVGHEWTAENLLSEQSGGIETALWTALRTLVESARLSRQLEQRVARRGQPRLAATFSRRAEQAEEQARVLREVLEHGRLP